MDTQISYSILDILSRVEQLKSLGKQITNLSIGEPDFNTPEFIKSAAIKALNDNFTKYTAVSGILSLKEAICNKLWRDNNLLYLPEQILVSSGVKHSLYNFFVSFLKPDDEVIIPSPYWLSYPNMLSLVKAKPVLVHTNLEQGYKITPEQLSTVITVRTRLLILNSPNNPTGTVYSSVELKAIAEILTKHPQIWIASDDIYEKIIWATEPFNNILNACPDLSTRTVVFNGVSKSHAMTGWRIGYAAGPKHIISTMSTFQSESVGNSNSIAQIASMVAITGSQICVEEMRNIYKDRHKYLYEELSNLPKINCHRASGAFYLFPDVSQLYYLSPKITNDIDLIEYLLTNVGLAVVPGSVFGEPNCIRISFCTSMQELEAGVQKFKVAYKALLK